MNWMPGSWPANDRPDAGRLFRSRPGAAAGKSARGDGWPTRRWFSAGSKSKARYYDQWPPAGHKLLLAICHW